MQYQYYLDDPKLSWEAKGVLTYYLREDPQAQVTPEEIQSDGNAGSYKVKRIVSELKQKRYYEVDCYQGDDGKFHWEHWMYAYKREEIEAI